MTNTTTNPSLLELAVSARDIWERVLTSALNDSATGGTCLFASVVLSTMINRFSKLKAVVRGGGSGDGGYLAHGELHGHYWVEAHDPETRKDWVIDITADQFGAPKVQILELPAARSIYHPGNQQDADDAVASLELPN